jgi:Family of unknown function (DUF6011)
VITWAPFSLPTAGAERVRELFALQEEHKPTHPGLWLPAPPFALRFRPKRSTVPTLEIILIECRKDEAQRIARWEWVLASDEAKPRHAHLLNALDTTTDLVSVLTRRREILVAALEHFSSDEQPFAGLDHCGICGRRLIDADSIARGIGPECLEMVFSLGRAEGSTALFVVKNAMHA